jgi:hypothetical protein
MKSDPRRSLRPSGELFSVWTFDQVRNGQVIGHTENHNVIPHLGLQYLLHTTFHGVTPITSWYLIAFSNNYNPVSTDTYYSPGYTEITEYDEATRPVYHEQVLSANELSNDTSPAIFTFNDNIVVYGGALVGGTLASTKMNDTLGVLYASAKAHDALIMGVGDLLFIKVYLSLGEV